MKRTCICDDPKVCTCGYKDEKDEYSHIRRPLLDPARTLMAPKDQA